MTWRHHPSREGATAYGTHFLKTWDDCERKGFLTYRAPHPTGGEGLTATHKSPNLLFGAALHDGLAAYYQSGWEDGRYDPEKGVAAFLVSIDREHESWYSREKFEEMRGLGQHMLHAYNEKYGHGGSDQDYPEIRVALDKDGAPIIEREFTIELGLGAVFTCRVDLAVMRRDWLCLMEHKTTTAQGVRSLFLSARYDSQFTGQYLVLAKHMGDQPIEGIIVNALLKNPTRNTPAFQRDYVYRPQQLVTNYRYDIANRLAHVDTLNDKYDALVAAGTDPWEAMRLTYPMRGMSNGLCMKYNSACAFLDLCLSTPHEQRVAESFQAGITTTQHEEPE